MSGSKLNLSMNVLQGVLSYRENRQQHANDLAQQRVSNAAVDTQEQLALQELGQSNALARRKLTFDFLQDQKAALQAMGSASVQAAWAGIEGGTANDILVSVQQELAQTEVLRDEGLRAIHEQSVTRAANITAQAANSKDRRNFTKPDVLASILGIGQNVLADYRETGKIG